MKTNITKEFSQLTLKEKEKAIRQSIHDKAYNEWRDQRRLYKMLYSTLCCAIIAIVVYYIMFKAAHVPYIYSFYVALLLFAICMIVSYFSIKRQLIVASDTSLYQSYIDEIYNHEMSSRKLKIEQITTEGSYASIHFTDQLDQLREELRILESLS
jgi:hypothetical protein